MIPSVVSLLSLATLSLVVSFGSGEARVDLRFSASPTGERSVRIFTPLALACDPDEVIAFLNGFLDAFNRGDTAALAEMFPTNGVYPRADKMGFQWYSVGDEHGGFVTYDPKELPTYFAARHRQHERLTLLDLSVRSAGFESGFLRPIVSLQFELHRDADDLSPQTMNGKGAAQCGRYKILVWSMAQERPLLVTAS